MKYCYSEKSYTVKKQNFWCIELLDFWRYLFSFQDFFHEGEYIVREGATGDTFFIINKGEVSEIGFPLICLPRILQKNSSDSQW